MRNAPIAASILALAALAACAPRGVLVADPSGGAVGVRETVFVATARSPEPGAALFGAGRIAPPRFARFEVSVPPDRPPGAVPFPGRAQPDPRRHFLVVEAQRLADVRAFRAALDAALRADASGTDEALVFVHGFNVNFAESVMRQAQIQYDYDRHEVAVLYSWPSAASPFRYLYDRESALFARRGLETTIETVAGSQARQFNLVAHSMGAFLAMETFSAMARQGHDAVMARTNAIILLAPDIEIDVFKEQARPILERGVPILIFASRRDRALAFSALLRGERDRVGSVRSAAELGGLPVLVYDVSAVQAGDPFGHFAVADSPALIGFLRGLGAGSGFWDYAPPPGRRTIGYAIEAGAEDLVRAIQE